MADCIYVGDEGTVFQVNMTECDSGATIDISSVTVKNITFKKPAGSLVVKAAEFVTNGEDGAIDYTTITGDLNEAGEWKIQAYVEGPGFKNTSKQGSFTVTDVLS